MLDVDDSLDADDSLDVDDPLLPDDPDEMLLIDDSLDVLDTDDTLDSLDADDTELTELAELTELVDDADDMELVLLVLDIDESLEPDERLEKLLGTLNRSGLLAPVNGMPACGSGICGTTCHNRWISTCRCCVACS